MFFAIPYFKNASYLKEALVSLIAQSDSAWSAVVFDDSIDPIHTEGAKKTIAALADSRIRYSRNEKNLGLAKNWNQGLDYGLKMGADLMTILHDDDRLLPAYVETMKAMFQKYPEASGYFCRCEIIDANGNLKFSLPDWYKNQIIPNQEEFVLDAFDGVALLMRGNFIFCPSVCYSLKKIKNKRFNEHYRMVMDFEFTLRILMEKGQWVGTYARPLYQYRRHGEAVTAKLNQNLVRYDEEMNLYRKTQKELTQLEQPKTAALAGKFYNLKLNLCSQILSSFLRLNWLLTFKQVRMLARMFLA